MSGAPGAAGCTSGERGVRSGPHARHVPRASGRRRDPVRRHDGAREGRRAPRRPRGRDARRARRDPRRRARPTARRSPNDASPRRRSAARDPRRRPRRVPRLRRLRHGGRADQRRSRQLRGRRRRRSRGAPCRILQEEHADVLTVYDDNGGYGHPDHVQVHRVGVRAAEIAGTPAVFEATMNRDHFKRLMAMQPEALDDIAVEDRPTAEDIDTLGVDEELITTTVDVRDYVDAEARRDGRAREPDRPGVVLPRDARRTRSARRSATSGSSAAARRRARPRPGCSRRTEPSTPRPSRSRASASGTAAASSSTSGTSSRHAMKPKSTWSRYDITVRFRPQSSRIGPERVQATSRAPAR